MKKCFSLYLFLTIVFSFVNVGLRADDLPKLAADGAIKQGKLGDGINWCIITNAARKGRAEFALLQKVAGGPAGTDDRVSVLRSCLDSLPCLGKRSPQGLATSYGTPAMGFIETYPDAVLLRFPEFTSAYGDAAIDSLLLSLFKIIDHTCERYPGRYGTVNQTIIVAGDVNQAALTSKFGVFSLMIPKKDAPVPAGKYVWKPVNKPVVNVKCDPGVPLASFEVTYRCARMDRSVMNTVAYTVSERMGATMETIIKKRIQKELSSRNIACADVSTNRVTGFGQAGDESVSVKVTLSPADFDQAVDVVASVLSELDGSGIKVDEYGLAIQENVLGRMVALGHAASNSAYVNRFVSSQLFNTDLASPSASLAFFQGKKIDYDGQVKHFNTFMSSILDSNDNMSLDCVTVSRENTAESVLAAYKKAWNARKGASSLTINQSDTLSFPDGKGKYKLSKTETEIVSGGTMWTFPNGMRVVYKKMNTSGIFHYSLAMNGGAAHVQDAVASEAAFYGDILPLCYVGPLTGRGFLDLLESDEITMDCKVSLSDICLSGVAASSKLSLLMKSLLMMSSQRKEAPQTYPYYVACEKLKLLNMKGSDSYRLGVMEEKVHPDYRYSLYKKEQALNEKTLANAEKLLQGALKRLNEGVLILVGDQTPEAVLKQIQSYVSQFPVSSGRTPRKSVQMTTTSGTALVTEKGEVETLDVMLSAQMHYTADNLYASQVAAISLQDALNKDFGRTDAYAHVSVDFQSQPQEILNYIISIRKADAGTLGAGTASISMAQARVRMEKTLAALAAKDLGAAPVNAAKTVVTGYVAALQNTPEYWLDAVGEMYLNGKNLTAGYADKIKAVTPAKVKEILSQLASSAKVEYTVEK